LVAALQAQVEKLGLQAVIDADEVGRYASEAEAAVYFACLQALRAAGGRASIRISGREGGIEFKIEALSLELGTQLQDIEDRIQALGGTVAAGSGMVTGQVGVRTLERVP
jgi:hypothetical protein